MISFLQWLQESLFCPVKKRDKYFNPSKMRKRVLLVSGKKLNTATSLSVGLKLEPSGQQKHHEIFGEGMGSFALGCNSYTCRTGRHVGSQAGLLQQYKASLTALWQCWSLEITTTCLINAITILHALHIANIQLHSLLTQAGRHSKACVFSPFLHRQPL